MVFKEIKPANSKQDFAIVCHAGAGRTPSGKRAPEQVQKALKKAQQAGTEILIKGGPSNEAVIAAVTILEDEPLCNAGRGAALNLDFKALTAASIQYGWCQKSGAIINNQWAKNPIQAAAAVISKTPHKAIIPKTKAWLKHFLQVEVVDPSYFITERNLRRTQKIIKNSTPYGHGTVGCVAIDKHGHITAGTSSGGTAGQLPGRCSDSGIIGAGTWADNNIGISTTGIGEYFMESVFSHDIALKIKYLKTSPAQAIKDSINEHLVQTGGDGGLIAIDKNRHVYIGYNSPYMGWTS